MKQLKDIALLISREICPGEMPLQISYLSNLPEGVTETEKRVPSGCTFWPMGQREPFFAKLDAHKNCEIGYFVMGASPDPQMQVTLGEKIKWMQDECYLKAGEENAIPRLRRVPSYVYYGPLGASDISPDVVLLMLDPDKAMIALEALGKEGMHPSGIPVLGRPACSIIPYILNTGSRAALSMGCSGFREFVDEAKGKVLVAIRGDELQDFAERLEILGDANRAVAQDARERKDGFASD
ncbi:MAG: DUF169 domain-containing protein [Methanomassiliicoccales archaeon]